VCIQYTVLHTFGREGAGEGYVDVEALRANWEIIIWEVVVRLLGSDFIWHSVVLSLLYLLVACSTCRR
jgi:hypothetical protein